LAISGYRYCLFPINLLQVNEILTKVGNNAMVESWNAGCQKIEKAAPQLFHPLFYLENITDRY